VVHLLGSTIAAMENPLFPRGIEPPGHTHAFDIYCQPFRDSSSDLPRVVLAKLKEDLKPFEQVGLIVLASVAFSIVGCFAYYPAPKEVFEEMYILRGEVLAAALSGNKKHAEHFIPIWDDWTHRLQVGVFLREGNLTAYRRMKARVFRDRLELLKHAVEEGDRDETREYIGLVNRAYGRMRLAYLQEQGSGTPP